MIIQKGDQYAIPFHITQGGVVISPDLCDNMIIKIGTLTRTAKATLLSNQLSYNYDTEMWEFWITKEETSALGTHKSEYFGDPNPVYVDCQIGIKMGDNIEYSEVFPIMFKDSLITEDWT